MTTNKIIYAGQPGTQKWIKRFGPDLVAVRYKYDNTTNKKTVTVELVAEVQDWQKNKSRIPKNKIVKLKIDYDEIEFRQKIKTFGAVWNKTEKVWELKFDIVQTLGLTERIVDNDLKND